MNGQILKALRESAGCLSGETLAARLGSSRACVRDQIRDLKEAGYVIEASPVGYRLVSSPDLLLPYEFPDLEGRIHYFPQVGSTMDPARDLARQGVEDGTMVVAEVQTRGRGRLSRQWLSPPGGIYFTLVLRPAISPAYASRVNLMAAVAVADTIKKAFGLDALVKWPNDVLLPVKKACGILAEMEAEVDVVKFINLGIGINANNPVSEFEERATSLKQALGRSVSRQEFLRALLTEIESWRALLMQRELLDEWRMLSATLDREVCIEAPGEVIAGKAVDVDDSGALIVEQHDGSLKRAVAGDCIQ